MVRISTRLNGLKPEEARERTQAYVVFMLSKCPDVSMKIERLHILGWNEHHIGDERDWKLQIAMSWNSYGSQPPSNTFWAMSHKPHYKEDLGLGGFHYC